MASMLPLTSLLNPTPPPDTSPRFETDHDPRSLSMASYTNESLPRHLSGRQPPANRESGDSLHSGTVDIVDFYPFEDLDEDSLREVSRFQIQTFGRIRDSFRRIPYNTGKRDFFEKTGRQCFEVFQYDFKIPGCESLWTVMWDVKIGLVRTTPFFKCCSYSKTISAKMLNQNPGLRDISHSITGGAIRAQGYWMPFDCAKAVCATFCYHISGALIPLFGPDFPAQCIPPNTPRHGHMVIDPAIIARSRREAENFRLLYCNLPSPTSPRYSSSISPRTPGVRLRIDGPQAYSQTDHRGGLRFRGGIMDSPYGTTTDTDVEGTMWNAFPRLPPFHADRTNRPHIAARPRKDYDNKPVRASPHGWTAVNILPSPISRNVQEPHVPRFDSPRSFPKSPPRSPVPDRWLSAIPGLSDVDLHATQPKHYHHPLPSRDVSRAGQEQQLPVHAGARAHASNTYRASGPTSHALSPGDKRTLDDCEYDAGESQDETGFSEPPSPRPVPQRAPWPETQLSRPPRCTGKAQGTYPTDVNRGTNAAENLHGPAAESKPTLASARSPDGVQKLRIVPLPGGPHIHISEIKEEIIKSTDVGRVESSRSSITNSDSTKDNNENSTTNIRKDSRTCFGHMEEVAALTLLRLGELEKQREINRAQQQDQLLDDQKQVTEHNHGDNSGEITGHREDSETWTAILARDPHASTSVLSFAASAAQARPSTQAPSPCESPADEEQEAGGCSARHRRKRRKAKSF
ncbi:hypothetical protein B0H66DRAFT_265955 [Apodospora peruviana]|uniref:HTH APSES-type domain-containing protein n=1 Tax=Apodospora peruviana TaxID=516989 RepID=A0AAE0I6N8_9PEZI|nr:hypothetical protein B0H66DRAFT_265955 [Apodospora peruviana]